MEITLIILVVAVVAVNIFLVFKLRSGAGRGNDAGHGLKLIQDQLLELNRTVDRKVGDLGKTMDQKMGESARSVQESMRAQLSESTRMQRLIKEITEEVGQVKEIGKQSLSVQDQLRDLQDILKNPKHRGILGEYYLETLLRNILPPGNFEMQYAFGNGEIVDAVIFIKDKKVCVDSKFSLENYNKLVEEKNPEERKRLERDFVNDLKTRIQETAKYVRPQEGTMEFAFMFIPHEAIYYDLLINKIGAITEETDNLIQRAANKYKVIIVSPTSFLAYLQTVMQGLKALQIEETAKDIIKRVSELGAHLKRYDEYHSKLGVSLSTTVNHYNASYKELKKVDKDVLRITGHAPGIEPVLLERPELVEE